MNSKLKRRNSSKIFFTKCSYRLFLINPILIVCGIWALTFIVYCMRLSSNIGWYPYLGITLIGVVLVPFITAYTLVSVTTAKPRRTAAEQQVAINLQKLNRVILTLIFISASIILFNLWYDGLPPITKVFGFQTETYMSYGRFKGLLFPSLCFIMILGTIRRQSLTGKICIMLSLVMLIIYQTRGFFMLAALQGGLVLIITTKKPRRVAPLLLIFICIFGVITMGVLGRVRLDREQLIEHLQIRTEYSRVPLGLLWTVAYVGMPFANAVHFYKHIEERYHGRVSFDRITPAFLPKGNWADSWKRNLPIPSNTVGTFISPIYWDFGLLGVIGLSFTVGLLSGSVAIRGSPRARIIMLPIIKSALLLMFFTDYFLYFPLLVEMFFGAIVIQYAIYYRSPILGSKQWNTMEVIYKNPTFQKE